MFKPSICIPLTLTAGLVAAQLSLSNSCQSALSGIVTNSDTANCLNPSALISIALNGGNTSIIQPIDTWLAGLCSAAPCTNATLESTTRTILSGCSVDLFRAGLATDNSSAGAIVTQVQMYYPTVRKVACLKDSGTFCATELLTGVQNVYGPLTISSLPGLLTSVNLAQLPSNITCSNCVKESYNIIIHDFPSLAGDANPALQSQCGSSFTDGSTPSGISQSASTASPGSKAANNAALGSFSVVGGVAISTMIVVSSALAILM